MHDCSLLFLFFFEDEEVRTILKVSTAAGLQAEKKYKFGVEIPRNPKHALELDKQIGTDGWAKSIQLELDQIMGYNVLEFLNQGSHYLKDILAYRTILYLK